MMKRSSTFFLAVLALAAFLIAPLGMIGQTKATTYKLQAVTSVSAGNKYVFVQSSHAMSNSVSSNALQTTASYSTTGLSGTESYVWTLETATGGFYMKNVSLSSSQYLLSKSSSTNVSFGSKGDLGIWSFSFSSGVATISAVNNSNRFLGYTSSTSYAYKAYATTNLDSYDHEITVYQLVEEVNYTITAQSNNNSYGTVSLSGKVITATPNSGYRVSTTTPYSVSPSGSATVAQNGNEFTVTPSANTTVTIYFEAIPTYTVTLGDNNETLTETSAGAGVTLPTRIDVSPYTFAGWSTTNNQTETTTAPTIINAGAYYPASDITLYPVYTRTEGGEVTQWQKVDFPSSGASLSGTYALLTPDGHAFKGSFSSGHGQVTSTAFVFSNNIATSVPSDVCELTFEAVSGGFKIKNANSTTTQYFYASAASSGKLNWHTSESSYWRSTGSNLLYNANSAYLRAYDNGSFRSYSGTNGQAIAFAKKVTTSASVTYYISVVTLPLQITISGSGINLTADDEEMHIVGVSYENLNTDNLGVTEYLYVECYTDASCTTLIPNDHWFTADFATAGASTDYESIEYMAEANTATEGRTVYMRVEHYSQTTDSWTYSNIITVTQEAPAIPVCMISPDFYDFGDVAINSTQSNTFHVSFANLTSDLSVSIDNTAYGFSVSSPTIETSTASSADVTVTFAPTAATEALTATLTISGGGLENNVQVLVGGHAVPSYTVTYICNGGKAQAPASVTVLAGGSYQLASGADLNSDFTFVGWTIDPEIVEDEDIYTAGEPITNVNSNETYYAVYSRTVFIPTNSAYVKVSQTPANNDWSGEYLIVYESNLDSQIESSRHLYVLDEPYAGLGANTYAIYEDIISDYSDGQIEYNETTEAYKVTVAATTHGYSIYDNGSEAYLGVSYTGSNNGSYLRWDGSYTANQNEWTLGVGSVVSVNNSGKAIRWNNNSGSYRFAIYATSGQEAIQLYKYTVNGVSNTTRYTRVFLNETITEDTEINGKSIIPSGSTLDASGKNFTNSTAANLVIEDGGQVILGANTVNARVQKNITGYGEGNGNWYLLTAPTDDNYSSVEPYEVTNLTPDNDGTTLMYDLYSFDQTKLHAEWQNFRDSDVDNKAFYTQKALLYARKESATIEFNVPLLTAPNNNHRMVYDADAEFAGWNLVGNSMMRNQYVGLFQYNEVSQTDVCVSTDYYRMNAAGTALELCNNGDPVAPMEGFFVQSPNNAQYYVYLHFSDEPLQTASKAIDINVAFNNAIADRARVRFGEGSMLGKFNINESATQLYIPQGNKDYAVVRSNGQGEMPVSFKAEKSGTYTINVKPENVDVTYLHLIDNLTGANVDLLANPSYSFEANKGDNANRFRLVFKTNTDVEENTAAETFAYFNGSEWVINGTGNATLQVIDMMGRVLSSEQINGNAAVNINQAAGIYMLRLINGENVMVQKVVVR